MRFFILLCFVVSSLSGQSSKIGKISKDSIWSYQMTGRIQLNTSFNHNLINEGQNKISFLVRRARLKFKGFVLSQNLTYKLELGLSNNDISGSSQFTGNAGRYIIDAYFNWKVNKNFNLVFGQAKLPGNRERIISSGELQLVDRSLLNSNFNIDRDIGLQVWHEFAISKKFTVLNKLSIAQGEGRNITAGNIGGLQYTGKIELFPFGKFDNKGSYVGSDIERTKTPKLALAFAYDFNDNAVRTRGNTGDFMFNDSGFFSSDITTFFSDLMFKYRGFSAMIEYASRDASSDISINEDGTPATDQEGNLTNHFIRKGKSYNMQMGYLIGEKWEVAGRYTNVNFVPFTNQIKNQKQYTLGLSKYLMKHKVKIQSDVSLFSVDRKLDNFQFRFQVEIGF